MKYIFLFVNPTSGGNKASIFTEFGVNEIIFHKPHKCHFFIYNILEGEKGKKPGFIKLSNITNNVSNYESNVFSGSSFNTKNVSMTNDKITCENEKREMEGEDVLNNNKSNDDDNKNINNNNNKKMETKKTLGHKDIFVYVLVAGGDGTLNWVLKEAEYYNINDNKFAIGVIPFGTGNDFAKAFGWKKIDRMLNHSFLFDILKKIVDQTFKSKVEKHDYWNIHVVLKEEGYFNKINSRTKKKETLLNDNKENLHEMKLCMSNYFSIGIDSRIGRGFERHRQKSAVCNKFIYAVEGCKKVSFKKNTPINLIIDKMIHMDNTTNNNNSNSNNNSNNNSNSVIFTTNHNESYPLLKKAMSIICINIPSYSSGNDIWNYTHKVGLILPKNITNDQKEQYQILKKTKQQVGDGILEFVIYQSGVDLGLEFTMKGRAYRVHQGFGPWKLLFKEQKYNVYFQVDGEYYLMSLPDFISIEHYKKINVLKNIL
ncbi:diacylglycerol kinase, putative [Plasmodium sp. gorilla clade G2]|uniref:diacylglycerol kinase, putative n=1 Tax=Plasmodium sp. gorilla clade G2 TaxID=880535 RepID=UPI000D220BFB|nr:diacylglycerol kinase, putative [Plasmodium sp. gorilla clade G2]SOV19918.1 diacylglycerol kinase, putative [Plasmodium sp. gorilla clade G2]